MHIRDVLGSELPIIQAPMAGAQGSALAIAACGAGALGSMPAALVAPDVLRDELTTIRAATSQPYNVNFFCHSLPVVRPEREAAWRTLLAPYYAELGLDPDAIHSGPTRAPFSHELADVVEPFRPRVVSFHFGLPAADLVARVRGWGSRIIASATTVDEARWLDEHGVDTIIAQGAEAGGHRGMFLTSDIATQIGTFALVPQIVAAVRVPVIAAGGIADARGVRAALALGASAVQVGTAYMLCPEATTSIVHRAALSSDGARHTALTNLFSGRPARGIVNRVMRDLGPMSAVVPEFPLASTALAPLRAAAEAAGKGDFSPLWSGQNASGCRASPAADITRELANGL
ncbi:MAG TPA: nitronate monooxygenase [Gemmatimonadaceae bacterium]|nr:nitronate monooxygenase [Gemmatimonadaceae bacterium]